MNKNLDKGLSAINIIIVLVVAGIIIGGIYFYLNSQIPKPENMASTPPNSESEEGSDEVASPTQEDLSQLSPKEMWLKIKKEVDETKNVDEFVAINMNYGSKERVAYWNSQMELYNSMEQSFKDSIFSMLKTSLPTLDNINVDGIKTNIVGDNAILEIGTKDSKEKAEATFVKEDGIWRLVEEVWE